MSGILLPAHEERALMCRVASILSAAALAKEEEAISGHRVFVRQRRAKGFHDLCLARRANPTHFNFDEACRSSGWCECATLFLR